MGKTIKIFIASSEELHLERLEFTDMVVQMNKALKTRLIEIEPVKWEYLDASMNAERKQTEYNNELKKCEICLVMYWTKFGEYTEEELTIAWNNLKEGHNPQKLYVYFKEPCTPSPELQKFKDAFVTKYGHFYCKFCNVDTMRLHFLLQLEQYMNAQLSTSSIVEISNSAIELDGKKFIDMHEIPFAANNEEYNDIFKSIDRTQEILGFITDKTDPRFKKYKEELDGLREKLAEKEKNLWETALLITKLCTEKCSERLSRAIDLFYAGKDREANTILKESEIDSDAEHNFNLITLGEQGKKGLAVNIDEYKLKVKILKGLEGDNSVKIKELTIKILQYSKKVYGENSAETAEAHVGYSDACSWLKEYREAEEHYNISLEIYNSLNQSGTLIYADVLRKLGKLHVKNDMFLKGEPYLVGSLDIIDKNYGKENESYIKGLRELAEFYNNMEEYDKALTCSQEALDIAKSLPECNKNLYVSLIKRLAGIYADKQLYTLEEEYGMQHINTYRNPEDRNKAISLFEEVLELEKDDVFARIETLCQLGSIYCKNNFHIASAQERDMKCAEKYYLEALHLSKDHNYTIQYDSILRRLAFVYRRLNTPEKAEALGYHNSEQRKPQIKSIQESISEFCIRREKEYNKGVNEIVNLYLKQHPRKLSYGTSLLSSIDDSELTQYKTLEEEELETIRRCRSIAVESGCRLHEVLETEGTEDLLEKLLAHNTPMLLNILDDVDLETPLKFTDFYVWQQDENYELLPPQRIGMDLTDDEFKLLLAEHLKASNRYSFNILVCDHPSLAQKIMQHMTWYVSGGNLRFGNYNPFICEMREFQTIANSILDPFVDSLGLFESEDSTLKQFAFEHQIVPDSANEIYLGNNENDTFHCLVYFEGRKLVFIQEGITQINNRMHDYEHFEVDGRTFLERFNLDSPKEIVPYLKEHYNVKGCFYLIKKEFER